MSEPEDPRYLTSGSRSPRYPGQTFAERLRQFWRERRCTAQLVVALPKDGGYGYAMSERNSRTSSRKTIDGPLKEVRTDPPSPPEPDPRLVQLVARAYRGEIPMCEVVLNPATLRVHNPTTLARARATLAEEPTARRSLLTELSNPHKTWLLYRDDEGHVVVFDDYASYAVALDEGIAAVRAQTYAKGTCEGDVGTCEGDVADITDVS